MAARSQANDRFYQVVWPHAPAVLRVARILVGGNDAEANDLAQETLLKAFKRLDRYQDGTDVKAWLMTILRNTRIDHARADASRKTVSLNALEFDMAAPGSAAEDPADWGSNPENVLNAFSDADIIKAMKHLPEEIRWTLLLVDVEGVDHAEAAKLLDVPPGTIKSRAFRGRAMLREALLPLARDRGLVPVTR